MPCHQFIQTTTRRDMLRASACGFGQLVLAALAAERARAESRPGAGPLPLPAPHFPPRARRIIFLFMWGGPSHVDLFDPKPRLNAEDGKQLAGKLFVPRHVSASVPAIPQAVRSIVLAWQTRGNAKSPEPEK